MSSSASGDEPVRSQRRTLDAANASASSTVTPGQVSEDAHRSEALWFRTQDFNATRTQLDPQQLRNDLIILAQHTTNAVLGIVQYQDRINDGVDSVRQSSTIMRRDLDSLSKHAPGM